MANNYIKSPTTKLKFVPYGIFNINSEIAGNGLQINDNQLIYGSENLIVSYNIKSGVSFIIKTMFTDEKVINGLQINEDRNLLAVSQRGSQALITIFSIASSFIHPVLKLKKIGVFSSSPQNTNEFSRMKFSYDSFYLGAISGNPNSHIIIFNIQNGQIVFSVSYKINEISVGIVDLAFNPDERCKIAVVGNGILNIFGFSQGKQLRKELGGFHIKELALVSVVWTLGDRIIAGTNDGRIVITENGFFRGIFNILSDDIIYYCLKSTVYKNTDTCDQSFMNVISVVPFLRGFLVYCELGIVVFEEYCEGWFKRRSLFRLPLMDLKRDNKGTRFMHYVSSSSKITITINEKEIMLLQMREYHIELIRTFMFLYHDGPLSSLSAGVLQPLVISSGKFDRRLVLWNYKHSLALKYWLFDDCVVHVAIHPSGLFCLVMFSEKFCFCYINVNEYCLDILDYFIYPADVGVFAESGGVFAVGNSFSVDVYSSLTLEKKKTIVTNVNSAMLTSLCFTDGDRYIWSCSINADVRKWHIFKGKVCWESEVFFSACHNTLAVQKNDVIHLVDGNGMLTEIVDSVVEKRLICLGDIQCITRSTNAVILGDKKGIMSFLNFPIDTGKYCLEQVFINKNGISQILAPKNNYVIVASNDGGVYMGMFFLVGSISSECDSKHQFLSCLTRAFLKYGNSSLPRNNWILNDCLKQLSGCAEKHKKKIFSEEDYYSILQINHDIEHILKNLFNVKTVAHYYRRAIRAFELYSNTFFGISRLCIGKIDGFYKQRLLEFSLCKVGNQGLGNLIRPIDMLTRFTNEKFINLYKITKLVIRKVISKAIVLSRKRINLILSKILSLNRNLSKYFYISNNPLNFVRFSLCRLFHKRIIDSKWKNKMKNRNKWEREMLWILKCEKRLFARLMSHMKINSALYKARFIKPSDEKILRKTESNTKNLLVLIKTYNKLKNCLVTSNFIFKNQD